MKVKVILDADIKIHYTDTGEVEQKDFEKLSDLANTEEGLEKAREELKEILLDGLSEDINFEKCDVTMRVEAIEKEVEE